MEAQSQAVKRKLDYYAKRRDVGEVVCLWECEFDQMLKDDADMKKFLTNIPYPAERLRIRTGLRGGRTETFRMLYTGDKNRKMYYIDKVRNERCPSYSLFILALFVLSHLCGKNYGKYFLKSRNPRYSDLA